MIQNSKLVIKRMSVKELFFNYPNKVISILDNGNNIFIGKTNAIEKFLDTCFFNRNCEVYEDYNLIDGLIIPNYKFNVYLR